MTISIQEAYNTFFPDYGDVVGVPEMCTMLGGASKKTVYGLLRTGKVGSFRLGKEYKIPKINIIVFLMTAVEPQNLHSGKRQTQGI